MLEAFGDGTEYDWALALQDEADAIQDDADRVLELKDVFEPSQLVDKMLTDEDILIRSIDIPERYQLARKPFKELALSADDMRAYIAKEAEWMCALMGPKKQLSGEIKTIFEKIVKTILHFMIVDNFDIPFIFSTRKDYLIYDERVPLSPHADDDKEDDIKFTTRPIRLLQYTDLWEMSELDLKYRALMEKRESLVTMFTALQGHGVEDELFLEMTEKAQTMEELQDIYDYVHFQYSTQLKDAQAVDSGYEDVNGGHGTTQKRVRSSKNVWDRIRNGRPYNLVKVLGTPADKVAQNILGAGQRAFIEDANERPDDLADSLVDAEDFPTGIQVLNAAKMMYAEELVMSPRMRKFARQLYYSDGVFDCIRTEKGLRQLDRDHPAYEFKYLKAQGLGRLVREPDVFLRMLKAEEDGLIEVTLRLQDPDLLQKILAQHIVTDNVSDIADSWNTIRKETINLALQRLCKIIIKGCKDSLRTEFETKLAEKCRAEYFSRLDQAPYKPKGHTFGVIPKILAISNGAGNRGDATCWAYVDDYGKALETGKFTDLRAGDPDKLIPEGKDVSFLVDLLERRPSDVIVISGWSIEAQKLYIRIEEIVKQKNLFVIIEKKDPETGETENITGLLPVELIDDEVARLYHTSERGVAEYPNLPPLTRYCIALARYAQSPVMEYAGLSRDIISISFDQHQSLIPREKLLKYLDMAMIEVVNSVGIEINEAAVDTRVANMLQYISGLGPRKATQMLQTINRNGNIVINRTHLLGDVDRAIRPACGPKIWENCASFVYIEWDETEQEADYLDYTRIHPEDYVLARKITADTLDLDEEDIRAEQDENGESAVIRRLLKDNAQDQLDELELGDYAAAIFEKQGLKKKATLELIRDELQNPFEELRNNFIFRSTSEIFTMLTGETEDTLRSGMLVTISIRRIYSDHLEVRLDSGIEGIVDALSMPLGVGPDSANDPRSVFQQYQTLRAKITKLDREKFKAFLTLREEEMTNPYRKEVDQPEEGQWDAEQESNDKLQVEKSQTDIKGRVQRVIKHPLYRPFNSAQAQEFLGTQSRGEVLIRPSGKGTDHLTVTWKVAENCFQHIDVLELDKENEFSVGRTLRVGGKSYSDLDELIELHVRAMAKKVDEIMGDERFQDGNKAATGMFYPFFFHDIY